TLRFNKLAERLPGISAKTLTEVLKNLQQTGLVKRQAFAEIPPRVEYHLTKEGNELTMLVAPLMVWADNRTGLVRLES
ncbi:MAG TPA: winged helix-turn-helix transcriptional regulator, partial [Candidatus Bathyarchaeia archaeon]|nr:winged helix-turn-helix transcriptional regulator [Candidatus Bathyarchaeia archaeon]